jgi:NADH-quinone oxidoreductase subunit F
LDLLAELAEVVKDTTMCGLGQTAPNPVLSTLRYFRHEYERHIVQKKCDAHVCKDIVGAPCHDSCPIGTEAWRYVAHIARGEFEEAYRVIRETNPLPSICARVCDHKCEANCRLGRSGDDPVAIRALKRFVTDNVDPSLYRPEIAAGNGGHRLPVAVIGSGPAGMTAAHYLSLKGYPVTVFESEPRPGGMLFNCIPSYRLPRQTLEREIASLMNDNLTLKCDTALGRDITIDGLLADGFKAVFLAIGAQKGRRPHVEGEDAEGVLPSIEFLKAFNIEGKSQAKGRVGVIGGGNSAVDAARTALRQPGVSEVSIIYRRTREEMPAFAEEIDAALDEGIRLEILAAPVKILTHKGRVAGVECIRNQLGDFDASGRRRPVPMPGTEFYIPLDTLIIAISESPDIDSISPEGEPCLQLTKDGTVMADPETLICSRPEVFAGGDVVTGPNTVVDAIAAGKRAAVMIDRYLHGLELHQPAEVKLPQHYVEPLRLSDEELKTVRRAREVVVAPEKRRKDFHEVHRGLTADQASLEARRCLRCDLEFTEPLAKAAKTQATEVEIA